MDSLHRVLDQEFTTRLVSTLFIEMLSKKLAEQGVMLPDKQKEKLISHLQSTNCDLSTLSDLSISVPWWRFWNRRDINIEFTEADLEAFDRAADQLTLEVPNLVNSLADETAHLLLRDLKRNWPRQSRHENSLRKGFVDRLVRTWGEPFNLLRMLITISEEIGDSVNEDFRAAETHNPYLVDVLTRLHARACQVASESMVLLQNGFADGAMARWRTLHEISVVSQIIAKGGEDLAERYALYKSFETHKGSRHYQEHADRLGYEPLSQEELDAIEESFQSLQTRLGHKATGDYDWAKQVLGNTKEQATFAKIEEAVGVDHLRPFWRMASHNVHANPKGVFFKLGLIDESDVLLSGSSDFGLADPGQLTAISLMQVTGSLTALDTRFDILVALRLMTSLVQEIKDSFAAVQSRIGDN